jgi:hypothetical protein
MSFKLGKLAPHPESTHPRVRLSAHLTGPAPVPAVVDWASKVAVWPELLNDQLGNCTAAGALHMFQAVTTYAGTEFVPTDALALALYERFGYNPNAKLNADGSNPTDNGAVEQDVLQDLVTHPIAGHHVVAFAQVDHLNETEMKQALDLFGSLYVGIECPASMQEQFAAGEVLDYVHGSPIEGGHCIVIQEWDEEYLYVVTWGKLVKMTWGFWTAYGEEAWAVITPDWIEANGTSPSGLNLTGLLSEFHEICGLANPSPKHAAPSPSIFQRVLNWLRGLLHKV